MRRLRAFGVKGIIFIIYPIAFPPIRICEYVILVANFLNKRAPCAFSLAKAQPKVFQHHGKHANFYVWIPSPVDLFWFVSACHAQLQETVIQILLTSE